MEIYICVDGQSNRFQCDELRPRCKKCKAYGVECDYDRSDVDLQLSARGSFQVDLVKDHGCMRSRLNNHFTWASLD